MSSPRFAQKHANALNSLEEQVDLLHDQLDGQTAIAEHYYTKAARYEKALRWIERFAYDQHQHHTGFTHIQRRAMSVLNPATKPAAPPENPSYVGPPDYPDSNPASSTLAAKHDGEDKSTTIGKVS